MVTDRLYLFARASGTKYHKADGLNNRNALSLSSGGQKSEIVVSVEMVPSKDNEKNLILGVRT